MSGGCALRTNPNRRLKFESVYKSGFENVGPDINNEFRNTKFPGTLGHFLIICAKKSRYQ